MAGSYDLMETGFSVDVRCYQLSEELQPFFTALYKFNIVCPPGEEITDWLHPEWAAMRFTAYGAPPEGAMELEEMKRRTPLAVSGPTSKAIRFRLTTSRIWGIGLQPAGWGQFVAGQASDFSDRIVDGSQEPAFSLFAPLLPIVQGPRVPPDILAEKINAYLLSLLGPGKVRVDLIRRVHEKLRDPEVAHVADLSERVGLGRRSLERICLRYFGFPPKLLLRRQRFLRSLARYMLDPQRNWSDALDAQYHDQAQFVRDFHSFMGMTPTEYAERPHPILNRILGQRMADLGAAPETDLPTILRYRIDAASGEPEQPRRQAQLR